MKVLPWILVVCLAGLLLWSWFRPISVERAKSVDTVFSSNITTRRDTVKVYFPMPVLCWHTGDTVHVGDTALPVEQKVYQDSNYTAYVSGYRPQLDSVFVYPQTVTITNTNDIYHTISKQPSRLGISLTLGYGFCKEGLSPAVVVGLSYRIW